MNGVYICVNSVFLSILTKGSEGKGERILEGTSIIFLDKNRIKKKNGTRVYDLDNVYHKIKNSNGKLNMSNFFVEEERVKYKGVESELFGLKRNKEYLYGGKVLDKVSGLVVHRIFIKRFPEAEFLELTNEEFNIYFNNKNLSLGDFNKSKANALNYINLKIKRLTENLGSRVNATTFHSHQEFWDSKKLKEFKERKSLLVSYN